MKYGYCSVVGFELGLKSMVLTFRYGRGGVKGEWMGVSLTIVGFFKNINI